MDDSRALVTLITTHYVIVILANMGKNNQHHDMKQKAKNPGQHQDTKQTLKKILIKKRKNYDK